MEPKDLQENNEKCSAASQGARATSDVGKIGTNGWFPFLCETLQ